MSRECIRVLDPKYLSIYLDTNSLPLVGYYLSGFLPPEVLYLDISQLTILDDYPSGFLPPEVYNRPPQWVSPTRGSFLDTFATPVGCHHYGVVEFHGLPVQNSDGPYTYTRTDQVHNAISSLYFAKGLSPHRALRPAHVGGLSGS
jgi:hypothetical protein